MITASSEGAGNHRPSDQISDRAKGSLNAHRPPHPPRRHRPGRLDPQRRRVRHSPADGLPVAAVSDVRHRREAGDWVTITLADGTAREFPTHVWLAVYPAGTWPHATTQT